MLISKIPLKTLNLRNYLRCPYQFFNYSFIFVLALVQGYYFIAHYKAFPVSGKHKHVIKNFANYFFFAD